MLITAFIHWPRVSAPAEVGLYWRVSLPIPARRITFAMRTLHGRHAQARFSGWPSDSSPFMWCTSLAGPAHAKQTRGPGGLHAGERPR